PQCRVLTLTLEPLKALPQTAPPIAVVKSRNAGQAAGFASSLPTSVAKAATLDWIVALSAPPRQALGTFARSFAKQPLVGSMPPVNLSLAFWTHSGSTLRFLPIALLMQPRSPFVRLAAHFFMPAEHLLSTGAGYPGSISVTTSSTKASTLASMAPVSPTWV